MSTLIVCYNIITLTGGNVIAVMNISQSHFHPGGGDTYYVFVLRG